MNEVTTKGELARLGMDALDRDRAGQVAVSSIAGGVSFASALEVMEFAKLMSVADKAVPKHLRANPGMCLAVTFQAIEWRMSPFAVANKSYEVNDRLAYESQLIHAVIEARAPLKERLQCAYEGEGSERVCIVTGVFRDGATREYRSPKFKDIRVKNSPLWKDDPDQQHWYYASRAFARKWCPDVLMGIYAKEELQEEPGFGRDDSGSPGLHEKLTAGARPEEGFQHGNGHVDRELAQIATGGGTIIDADPARGEQTEPKPDQKPRAKKTDKKSTEPATAISAPKTAAEYVTYAEAWIEKMDADKGDDAEARWDGEYDMRAALSVPVVDRNTLRAKLDDKFGR